MSTTEHPTSVRLPSDIKAALVQMAEADGRSISNYIVQVLKEHVASKGKSKGTKR